MRQSYSLDDYILCLLNPQVILNLRLCLFCWRNKNSLSKRRSIHSSHCWRNLNNWLTSVTLVSSHQKLLNIRICCQDMIRSFLLSTVLPINSLTRHFTEKNSGSVKSLTFCNLPWLFEHLNSNFLRFPHVRSTDFGSLLDPGTNFLIISAIVS